MADIRPTLSQIIDRIEKAAAAAQPGVSVGLQVSLATALQRSFAGAISESWGYLQRIADDGIPDTAIDGSLERWADVWGVTRQQPIKATGTVDFTAPAGKDTLPTIPIGTRVVRGDGAEYETTSLPVIESPEPVPAQTVFTATAQAVEAGADGNFSGAAALVEPLAEITDVAVDASGGVDLATDDELRAALLSVLQAPPQGGTADDFARWALENGATRAWVQDPVAGSPTFTVYLADDALLPAAPVPGAGIVSAVQAAYDAQKPITADPVAAAGAFESVDPAITISPNTTAMQDAVSAELQSMLDDEAGPGTIIPLSKFHQAISRTPGLVTYTLTTPAADFAPAGLNIAWLGTPVYS